MHTFILRRLGAVVPVLLAVSVLVFLMSHLTPGDPATIMLGENASAADVARLRHELGLDRPLAVQYGRYLAGVVRGDLGRSIRSGQPVAVEIWERFPPTLQLTLAAMVIAAAAGVLLGALAATSRTAAADALLMGTSLLGISMPSFWLGLLLILLFGLVLRWFPIAGGSDWRALVLPAVTLGTQAAAVLARLTRASLLDVLPSDFVRTARAKGVAGTRVLFRHALRNALIPVVTVIGLQFGALLGGAVIVESVFARSGLGRFAVAAVQSRDFPVIQGIVLFAAAVYALVNLSVDVAYLALDPRITYDR
ncbi:MAG TPA: nickel ABC transporter permease [bacterium]|nr:nickel ABC transporter permease [bacterium]